MSTYTKEDFQKGFAYYANFHNTLNVYDREGKEMDKGDKRDTKTSLIATVPYVGSVIGALVLPKPWNIILISGGSLYLGFFYAKSMIRQSREIDPPRFNTMEEAEEYYLNLGQERNNKKKARPMFVEEEPQKPILRLLGKPESKQLEQKEQSQEQMSKFKDSIKPHLYLVKNGEEPVDTIEKEVSTPNVEEIATNMMFLIHPGLASMGINMPNVTLTYNQMYTLTTALYEKWCQKGRDVTFEDGMMNYILQTTYNLFSTNPRTDTNEFSIYTLLDGLEFLVPLSLKPQFSQGFAMPLSESEAIDIRKEVIDKIGRNNVVPLKNKNRVFNPFNRQQKGRS